MPALNLIGKTSFRARAVLVGERIDLKALEAADRLASSPLAISVRGGGVAVLFKYGVVVMFDVAALEEAAFLGQLETLVAQPYTLRETESVEVRIEADCQEGLEGDVILLRDVEVPRLQLVADILAKSVVLAYYESQVAGNFDRIEPLAVDLQRRGGAGPKAKDVLRHIGGTLLSEHNMVGRVEVTDKPDLLWERADLERLFQRLEGNYEIRERHTAIERKLDLISRTAETVLDLVQTQRSMRVEWYVVILIVFEILLTLYEMFVRGKH